MNWYISTSSLILIFWAIICCIPTCSAGYRVIRLSNSPQFIHHGSGPKEESSEERNHLLPLCRSIFHDQLDNVDTSTESVESTEDTEFEEHFGECEKLVAEFGCYEILPNKSVHVPTYRRIPFGPTQYYIAPSTKILFICLDFFDENKFPNASAIVFIVGRVISSFCIVLHLTMFIAFKKIGNLPGYCLVSLSVALLVAYLFTFIHFFRKRVSDCTATGLIKVFAFLGSYFWMNVMSYDIWRSLKMSTAKLRLTGGRPMLTRFAIYSAYAWGVPLFIIAVGLIVNAKPGSYEVFNLIMDPYTCWFHHKLAMLVYYFVPLFVLLIFTALLFNSIFRMINSSTLKKSENKADLWSRFLVSFRLAVVMGLMWILTLSSAKTYIWYLYELCNVLQGVFIFFSFPFKEMTRKECRKATVKKKSSKTRTQVSSQQSSSV